MEERSACEAAKNRGIPERRTQKPGTENRMLGAEGSGCLRHIPQDAERPQEEREKGDTLEITIEALVQQYGGFVFNFACRLSGRAETAEDLAQETFMKAWQHLDELKDPAAAKQWLRTICLNEFRMAVRKSARQKITYVESMEELEKDGELLVSAPESTMDEVQASEDVAALRNGCFLAMTRKLSLNQRIAFSLVDMFGLSVKEAAGLLGVTPKAAKGLLYRARMNLDSFFQGHCYFLNTENPCRCEAWIEFFKNRAALQSAMEEKLLDYKEKGYTFDLETRKRVAFYYRSMPEQAPGREWYQKVLLQIKPL